MCCIEIVKNQPRETSEVYWKTILGKSIPGKKFTDLVPPDILI
jgi:hypothetical protein